MLRTEKMIRTRLTWLHEFRDLLQIQDRDGALLVGLELPVGVTLDQYIASQIVSVSIQIETLNWVLRRSSTDSVLSSSSVH